MKLYCRRRRVRREEYPLYLSEEIQEWLIKMALGFNLNSKIKYSLPDGILEKNINMHFDYISSSRDSDNDDFNSNKTEQQDQNNATNTINLDNLPTEYSRKTAKNLAEKKQSSRWIIIITMVQNSFCKSNGI